MRSEYLDPNTGRFTTRDSIGIWGDPNNLGNGYTYTANNPQTFVDPYGLSIYSDFGFGKPREIHFTEAEIDFLKNSGQAAVITGAVFIPVFGPYIASGLLAYDAYDTYNNGDVVDYIFLGAEVTQFGKFIPDSAKDRCGDLLNYLRRNNDNITVPNHLSNSDIIENVASGKVKFKRWKVGEPIDKPMPDGSLPDWDGVLRSRYWKNRAFSAPEGEFSKANLEKMRQGYAPLDFNPRTLEFESREIHHVIPQRFGGSNNPLNVRELTPDQHGAVDPFRNTVPTTRGIQ